MSRSCSTASAGLEKWFWISQNSKTYPPADPGILGVKIQWILEFPCRRQAPKFLPVFCMAPHGRAYMEIPESTGISAVQPEFWNFRAESARRGARPAAGAVILEYPKFSLTRARRTRAPAAAVRACGSRDSNMFFSHWPDLMIRMIPN